MNVRLIDSGWDKVLNASVSRREPEMRIVCPFIKKKAVQRLFRSGYKPIIRVITRFNLTDFCNGVSDVDALRLLIEQGAEIRGVRDLHAKVYLFGESEALVTSANLTEAALTRNHEFGFSTLEPAHLEKCGAYFEALWSAAGESLTEERIKGWEAKLADAKARGFAATRDSGLPDDGADASHRGVPISVPSLVAEVEQSFVKFLGKSDNRVPIDTPVYDEVLSAGCHWACCYPIGKRPNIVKDGAVLFISRLIDDGDIMIFGRAIGMAHVPGRDDATDADMAFKRGTVDREWKEYWPHYIRVHHGEFLAGTLQNAVRLSELMDDLKYNSFATTKARHEEGEKDIEPRRAYAQQPAVRLSDEGYAWLNERLELAFRTHGKLSPAELQSLDWPSIP